MKKLAVILLSSLLSFGIVAPVQAAAETKKVCVDVKDKEGKVVKNKDGSNKQNCKEMKVHQKLEGTKVPEKK
jgi:hypothetical protein